MMGQGWSFEVVLNFLEIFQQECLVVVDLGLRFKTKGREA